MDSAELLARRLSAQHLTGARPASPAEVVSGLLAVQSQDVPAAAWAVTQRLAAPDAALLDGALLRGEVVRTHVLRPTWHHVAAADLRWLLRLTGPRVDQAAGSIFRRAGLDATTFEIFEAAVSGILAGRSLTRPELYSALSDAGIDVSDQQRIGHLLLGAEIHAVVCGGPPRDGRHTYVLLDEHLPADDVFDRDAALHQLAFRFIRGHGPATAADLSWWSGLTLGDARRGLRAAALATADIDGRTYYFDHENVDHAQFDQDDESGLAGVFLLPNYDEYLIAFARRDDVYPDGWQPPEDPRRNPIFSNVVLDAGRVVGSWRRTVRSTTVLVQITPLVALTPRQRRAIDQAAQGYADFVDRGLELRIAAFD